MNFSNHCNFSELLGKTLVAVEGRKGDDSITFRVDNGDAYVLYHSQDCCESVRVEDVCGELSDLIGAPILQAEENSSNENPSDVKPSQYQDSFTWTFYRIATMKGQVVLRWYGESNGYYSETVSCAYLKKP